MAQNLIFLIIVLSNIILILAEVSNEDATNEASKSVELNKLNNYAQLVPNEKIDEDNQNEGENRNEGETNNENKAITILDDNAFKDFVLDHQEKILELLKAERGEGNDSENNGSDAKNIELKDGDKDYGPNAELYRTEVLAGNRAEDLGKNPHYYQPHAYKDLGRRHKPSRDVLSTPEMTDKQLEPKLASPEFVLEVAKKSALLEASKPKNLNDKTEKAFILRSGNYWDSVWKEDVVPAVLRSNALKDSLEVKAASVEKEVQHLKPKLASPEFVLDVAKKSALLEASKPKNPTEDVVEKSILRSGNYWNSVWKEDVNPKILRSNPSKHSSSLGIVRTKINPGSKLYDLVKKLVAISPRLIYVINKKNEDFY